MRRHQSQSTQSEVVRVEGIVKEVLPGAVFQVELCDGHRLRAHVATELRLHCVRVLPGDTVNVQVSHRDWSRGRIVSAVRK